MCPHCDYCPHCGRSAYGASPWVIYGNGTAETPHLQWTWTDNFIPETGKIDWKEISDRFAEYKNKTSE